MKPDFKLCPPRMVDLFGDYINYGIPLGSFGEAVLTNNLRNAVFSADGVNLLALPHIVAFVYEHLPAKAWGSPQAYRAWIQSKKEQKP